MSETIDNLSTIIADPLTGEIIPEHDADALCEALQRIQAEQGRLRSGELAMRGALARLATGDERTAHVIGARFRATIERPAPTWDNATLRRLWEERPEARAYLRLEKVAPALREIAKLRKSSGPGVESFRDELLAAEKPSSGVPSVKVALIEREVSSAREPDERAHYATEIPW